MISYVESKTEAKTKVVENRWRLEEGCGVWGAGEGSQKAHASSCKSWDITYCMAPAANYCTAHLKDEKGVDLQSSHHKKNVL